MLAVATPIMAGPLAGAARWPLPVAVAATATYVANWACVVDVDALGPVIHTWSLAIEEQFYLLWPAAFIGLSRSRRSPVRWLSAGLVVIVVGRAVGWLLAPGVWPYFDTVTHADGLLAGCLLAVLLADRPHPTSSPIGSPTGSPDRGLAWSRRAAAAGIVVLVGIAATLDVDSPLTYLAGLTLGVAGTVAVVRHLVLHPGGRLSRALQWTPLVGVGRISYGVYLFHLPLFQLVQHYQLGFVPTVLGEFGGTFALAVLSWFLLERPALNLAHRTRSTFNRTRRLVVPV
jgi:peptidoglycan/LPS O-acetylase OafA/YrhL